MNELDEAYTTALRTRKVGPELICQLQESVLTYLMPYHPEMVGTFEVGNGYEATFSVWHTSGKAIVPIFTSLEQAERALKAVGATDREYCLGEIKGAELFLLVASQEVPAVINPACGIGELSLDLGALAKLAKGPIVRVNEKKPPS